MHVIRSYFLCVCHACLRLDTFSSSFKFIYYDKLPELGAFIAFYMEKIKD